MKIAVEVTSKGKHYLGKVDNDIEEKALRRVDEQLDSFRLEVREVSNGTYESLENGELSIDEI